MSIFNQEKRQITEDINNPSHSLSHFHSGPGAILFTQSSSFGWIPPASPTFLPQEEKELRKIEIALGLGQEWAIRTLRSRILSGEIFSFLLCRRPSLLFPLLEMLGLPFSQVDYDSSPYGFHPISSLEILSHLLIQTGRSYQQYIEGGLASSPILEASSYSDDDFKMACSLINSRFPMVPTSKIPPSFLINEEKIENSTQSPFGILPLPSISLSGFAFSILASALPLFEASTSSNVLLMKLYETLSLSLTLFIEPESLYIEENLENKSREMISLECKNENMKRIRHILNRFDKLIISLKIIEKLDNFILLFNKILKKENENEESEILKKYSYNELLRKNREKLLDDINDMTFIIYFLKFFLQFLEIIPLSFYPSTYLSSNSYESNNSIQFSQNIIETIMKILSLKNHFYLFFNKSYENLLLKILLRVSIKSVEEYNKNKKWIDSILSFNQLISNDINNLYINSDEEYYNLLEMGDELLGLTLSNSKFSPNEDDLLILFLKLSSYNIQNNEKISYETLQNLLAKLFQSKLSNLKIKFMNNFILFVSNKSVQFNSLLLFNFKLLEIFALNLLNSNNNNEVYIQFLNFLIQNYLFNINEIHNYLKYQSNNTDEWSVISFFLRLILWLSKGNMIVGINIENLNEFLSHLEDFIPFDNKLLNISAGFFHHSPVIREETLREFSILFSLQHSTYKSSNLIHFSDIWTRGKRKNIENSEDYKPILFTEIEPLLSILNDDTIDFSIKKTVLNQFMDRICMIENIKDFSTLLSSSQSIKWLKSLSNTIINSIFSGLLLTEDKKNVKNYQDLELLSKDDCDYLISSLKLLLHLVQASPLLRINSNLTISLYSESFDNKFNIFPLLIFFIYGGSVLDQFKYLSEASLKLKKIYILTGSILHLILMSKSSETFSSYTFISSSTDLYMKNFLPKSFGLPSLSTHGVTICDENDFPSYFFRSIIEEEEEISLNSLKTVLSPPSDFIIKPYIIDSKVIEEINNINNQLSFILNELLTSSDSHSQFIKSINLIQLLFVITSHSINKNLFSIHNGNLYLTSHILNNNNKTEIHNDAISKLYDDLLTSSDTLNLSLMPTLTTLPHSLKDQLTLYHVLKLSQSHLILFSYTKNNIQGLKNSDKKIIFNSYLTKIHTKIFPLIHMTWKFIQECNKNINFLVHQKVEFSLFYAIKTEFLIVITLICINKWDNIDMKLDETKSTGLNPSDLVEIEMEKLLVDDRLLSYIFSLFLLNENDKPLYEEDLSESILKKIKNPNENIQNTKNKNISSHNSFWKSLALTIVKSLINWKNGKPLLIAGGGDHHLLPKESDDPEEKLVDNISGVPINLLKYARIARRPNSFLQSEEIFLILNILASFYKKIFINKKNILKEKKLKDFSKNIENNLILSSSNNLDKKLKSLNKIFLNLIYDGYEELDSTLWSVRWLFDHRVSIRLIAFDLFSQGLDFTIMNSIYSLYNSTVISLSDVIQEEISNKSFSQLNILKSFSFLNSIKCLENFKFIEQFYHIVLDSFDSPIVRLKSFQILLKIRRIRLQLQLEYLTKRKTFNDKFSEFNTAPFSYYEILHYELHRILANDEDVKVFNLFKQLKTILLAKDLDIQSNFHILDIFNEINQSNQIINSINLVISSNPTAILQQRAIVSESDIEETLSSRYAIKDLYIEELKRSRIMVQTINECSKLFEKSSMSLIQLENFKKRLIHHDLLESQYHAYTFSFSSKSINEISSNEEILINNWIYSSLKHSEDLLVLLSQKLNSLMHNLIISNSLLVKDLFKHSNIISYFITYYSNCLFINPPSSSSTTHSINSSQTIWNHFHTISTFLELISSISINDMKKNEDDQNNFSIYTLLISENSLRSSCLNLLINSVKNFDIEINNLVNEFDIINEKNQSTFLILSNYLNFLSFFLHKVFENRSLLIKLLDHNEDLLSSLFVQIIEKQTLLFNITKKLSLNSLYNPSFSLSTSIFKIIENFTVKFNLLIVLYLQYIPSSIIILKNFCFSSINSSHSFFFSSLYSVLTYFDPIISSLINPSSTLPSPPSSSSLNTSKSITPSIQSKLSNLKSNIQTKKISTNKWRDRTRSYQLNSPSDKSTNLNIPILKTSNTPPYSLSNLWSTILILSFIMKDKLIDSFLSNKEISFLSKFFINLVYQEDLIDKLYSYYLNNKYEFNLTPGICLFSNDKETKSMRSYSTFREILDSFFSSNSSVSTTTLTSLFSQSNNLDKSFINLDKNLLIKFLLFKKHHILPTINHFKSVSWFALYSTIYSHLIQKNMNVLSNIITSVNQITNYSQVVNPKNTSSSSNIIQLNNLIQFLINYSITSTTSPSLRSFSLHFTYSILSLNNPSNSSSYFLSPYLRISLSRSLALEIQQALDSSSTAQINSPHNLLYFYLLTLSGFLSSDLSVNCYNSSSTSTTYASLSKKKSHSQVNLPNVIPFNDLLSWIYDKFSSNHLYQSLLVRIIELIYINNAKNILTNNNSSSPSSHSFSSINSAQLELLLSILTSSVQEFSTLPINSKELARSSELILLSLFTLTDTLQNSERLKNFLINSNRENTKMRENLLQHIQIINYNVHKIPSNIRLILIKIAEGLVKTISP